MATGGASPGTAASHFTVQMPGPADIEWDVEEGDWAEDRYWRPPGGDVRPFH